jgi:hypothetical protein
MRTDFTEHKGKLQNLDGSFDLKFWQSQPAQVRFNATWDLIVHAAKVKGTELSSWALFVTAEH